MRRASPALPYAAAGLSDEAAAAHALNRLAYGPRPGEAAEVARTGLEAWVEAQLAPPARDPDLERRLSDLRHVGMDAEEIGTTFVSANHALKIAVDRGDFPEGSTPRDAGIRDRLLAWMEREGLVPHRELRTELIEAKTRRAVYARAQLREVLTDFWYNHFNVDGRGQGVILAASYEAEAIRPNLLAPFRTLLGAVARHPALLVYLDNHASRAEPGRRLAWGRRPARRGGLNENFGRELMELHTLGVDGGYTQDDVREVARAFTGWTVYPYRGLDANLERALDALDRLEARGGGVVRDGLFLFRPNWHDAEEKTVLGQRLPAGRGVEDGEDVLDLLAAHPSTARHVSEKLAIRFIRDDPDERLVGRLATVFERTDGDLLEVMRAVVRDEAFWEAATGGPDGAPSKVKTPFEYVASAARATGTDIRHMRGLGRALRDMGEPVYHAEPPTGFPDHAEAWVNAGLLLTRMNLGLNLAAGTIRGARPDLRVLTGGRQPESVDAALDTVVEALLPGRPPAPTVRLLRPIVREPAFADRVSDAANRSEAEAPSPALDDDGVFEEGGLEAPDARDTAAFVVGVVLGSPAFQRQ